jgi:hypothetical protein
MTRVQLIIALLIALIAAGTWVYAALLMAR